MSIDADDLARTALVDLIPRHRYRTAGRSDERFASFAPLGVLDYAERSVMQVRRGATMGGAPGIVGLLLGLLALRLAVNIYGDVAAGRWLALPQDLVLLLGVLGAGALALDYNGIRSRLPG